MSDVRIRNWDELNEQLYRGSWQEELGRHRSSLAFRGMPDSADSLVTSLIRLQGSFAELEGHLLRNFRKYAHHGATLGDSQWYWLALAQHHGLPTRLLDWTYSPYVAAHFATADPGRAGVDAVIWCVDFVRTNQFLPPPLKACLEQESSVVFTAEMLDRVAPTLQDLDDFSDSGFVIFFEPPSLDERIVNQYALFALMSSPTARFGEWLAHHPDLFRRIIIPAEVKWEIRDKLDQANITERVLLPGLDGLCQWLARYYSPRPGSPADREPGV